MSSRLREAVSDPCASRKRAVRAPAGARDAPSHAHRNLAADASPTYRARLCREGLVLAGCGAVAAAMVLVFSATVIDALFVAQFAAGVALLAVFGPRSARKAMARSEALAGSPPGSGEPTPLWHVAAIVAVGTALFFVAIDGIAGLSFATGAALVGLAQAFLLAPTVAREERRTGRRFFRRPGSRIIRGTKLGWNIDDSDGARGPN